MTLDQTLLGPVPYRGGDLELLPGRYAEPADDCYSDVVKIR